MRLRRNQRKLIQSHGQRLRHGSIFVLGLVGVFLFRICASPKEFHQNILKQIRASARLKQATTRCQPIWKPTNHVDSGNQRTSELQGNMFIFQSDSLHSHTDSCHVIWYHLTTSLINLLQPSRNDGNNNIFCYWKNQPADRSGSGLRRPQPAKQRPLHHKSPKVLMERALVEMVELPKIFKVMFRAWLFLCWSKSTRSVSCMFWLFIIWLWSWFWTCF